MKTLLDLLNKLCKAEAGSRELDGDVWWMCMPREHRKIFDSAGYIQETIDRPEDVGIGGGDGWPGKGLAKFYDSSRTPPSPLDYAPALTTNLTEALRYIPKGWILEHLGDDAAGRLGEMELLQATAEISNGLGKVYQGQGSTRELAVLIACVRAIIETKRGEYP